MSLEVEYKGVQIGQLTSDGTLTLETAGTYCEDDIEITYSGGGGGAAVSNDVDFIDYDGTVVASYTAAEFAQLSALPPNPSHTGLVSQGWNWSLSDAQTYVASYGELVIGQMYTTSSGATEIDIELHDGALEPYCSFYVKGTVTIDWGDGYTDTVTTSTDTKSTKQHTYSAPGIYTIKIIPDTGTTYTIGGGYQTSQLLWKADESGNVAINQVYTNSILAVRIGAGCSVGRGYPFYNCGSLKYITIPNTVTAIGGNFVQNCRSLISITLPSSMYNGQLGSYNFNTCTSLESISIPKKGTSLEQYAFAYCDALRRICIPSTVLSIKNGVFSGCRSLVSVIIPSSVTSMGNNVFYGCSGLKTIAIPSSVTTIGTYTFYDDKTLRLARILGQITKIDSYMFYTCYLLTDFTIPSTVTRIEDNAFYMCYSLSSITIPNSVTYIGSTAFYYCYGLKEIHFKRSSPPTIASSNAFSNLPTNCKIYVPAGSLSAYRSATNYPSSSTYTYIEE